MVIMKVFHCVAFVLSTCLGLGERGRARDNDCPSLSEGSCFLAKTSGPFFARDCIKQPEARLLLVDERLCEARAQETGQLNVIEKDCLRTNKLPPGFPSSLLLGSHMAGLSHRKAGFDCTS